MMEFLNSLFGLAAAKPYIKALVIFAAVVLIGLFLRLVLTRVVRRLVSRSATKLDDVLFGIYAPQIKWLTLVVGLSLGLEQLLKGIPRRDETSLGILGVTEDLLFTALVLILTVLVARTVNVVIGYLIDDYSRKNESDLSKELSPLLQRLSSILAAIIALIIVMERFGIPGSSLLVFLGGGSVALALASQDTLSNMIAGFVIMIDRPFRVGDRIKLPGGDIGDVYEIGLRSTKIMDFDQNLIISPNAELIKAQVINYAYPHRLVRVLVEVGVAYGTDTHKARRIMIDLARKHPHILPEIEPEVHVLTLGDSSVGLRLAARTDDFTKKFQAETQLREQIHEAFPKEGIEIPFPQRVLHFAPEKHERTDNRKKRATVRRKRR